MESTFDHVGLSLADLDAGEAFYGRAFGFAREFEFALDPYPIRGVMLVHPSGCRLELFQHELSSGGIRAETPIAALVTRGYGHFAIAAASIGPLYETALSAGARAIKPPAPSPEPGVRFAFVADPEGNLVELVERAAR